MLKYLTMGAHDLKASAAFYDKVLGALGYERLEFADYGMGYGPAGGKAQLWIMRPGNGLPASYGNGTMIALVAPSRSAVDEFHALALSSGGYDEGKPGIRGGADSNFYAAYVRDPNGNKLSAVCDKPVT